HLALGDFGWTVSVVPAPPRVRPLRPRANPAGLLLPALAPGRVVVIADPRTGQDLLVGTLRAEGEALAVARRTPGFTLRATWQGVVVAPIADRLSLTALKDGFELAGAGAGLHLSAALPAVADSAAAAHLTRSFDLPRLPRAALLRQLQACTLADAQAPPLARTAPRLDCARALLALGMGAEAEALLHLARAQDAALARDRGVAALQAVAALMAGRPEDAAALDDPRLPMTDEIAFWRAVRIAERRPGAAQAATAFAATAPLALAYPAALRRMLLPLAAETMALGGEPDAAASLLGARPADDPRLAYAHGLLLARAGDDAGALRIFDALARSRDQMLAARGATRAVLLRAKAGQLAPAAAADALGPLLVEWPSARGKLRVWLAMARLRQAAGEWPAAFAALRRADALYPAERARIRGRIAAAFAALLRPAVAEAVPPLAFAALAEDNAALLPPGAASGRLPRLLADRLIALDLGDRAAPIIARLMAAAHGPARAGLGARLAALRLQMHDAAGALAALDASRSDGLAPALAERRRLLRARGLAERGDRDAAVALLAGMDSTAGDDLRAHLLAQAKDWPAAEAALRSVVARTVPAHGPLATEQRSTLLRLASAAAQAGDATELAELHGETARMGDGRLGRLFRLLTAGPVQTASDLPRSAAEIALARAVPADLAAIGSH
ncbi:MAG TPA: hypothetical protein VHY76_00960, partial [Acetobacteraceae bacterium]|nr:hypothetical protein [Acetobacteraceae bacterium]